MEPEYSREMLHLKLCWSAGLEGDEVMQRLSANTLNLILTCICCLLYLVIPAASTAEISLSFIPIEEAKYLLRGEGCEGATSFNFAVDYDTTYLSAPEVTVMGGRLPEGDRGASTPPGNLQLHILNEDHNAVFEATVFFLKRGDYPPVINFVTAEVADLSGAVRPVSVAMMTPVNSPQSEEVPVVTNPVRDQAAPSPEGVAVGSIWENGVTANSLPPAVPPTSVPAMTAPPVTQVDSEPETPQKKAVAELFRDFSGGKSLAAFTALFAADDPCCRQIPPVVIADGRRTVRVFISGKEGGEVAPLFTVSGGRLVSAERDREKKEWITTVQPDENEWDVRLRSAGANGIFDYPLIVAPAINVPLRKLVGLDEKSFMPRLQSFLAGKPAKGTAKSPVWLREYLFTANYLAARGER